MQRSKSRTDRTDLVELVDATEAFLALHTRKKGVPEREVREVYGRLLEALRLAKEGASDG